MKTENKKTLKSCLGTIIILAGVAGFIYLIPSIGRACQKLTPTARQTIILSIVIIAATSGKKGK